jgi:hypothetical protein
MGDSGKVRVNCQQCFGSEQCDGCAVIEKQVRAAMLAEIVAELRVRPFHRWDGTDQHAKAAEAADHIEQKFGDG